MTAQGVPWTSYLHKTSRSSPCIYCGALAQVGDHVLPSMKQFTGQPFIDLWNLRPACWPCNTRKGGWQSREFDPELLFEACKTDPGLVFLLYTLPVGKLATGLPQFGGWRELDGTRHPDIGAMLRRHIAWRLQTAPEKRKQLEAVEQAAMAIMEAHLEIERVNAKIEREDAERDLFEADHGTA